MATLPGAVLRRRSGKVPVIVAVASTGRVINKVDVFSFEPHAISWSKVGQSLIYNETIESTSVGSSGSTIVLVVGLHDSNRALAYKVPSQTIQKDWNLVFEAQGSICGISGDGSRIVASTTEPRSGVALFDISNLTSIDEPRPQSLVPAAISVFAFERTPVILISSYNGDYGSAIGQIPQGTFGIGGVGLLGIRFNYDAGLYDVDRVIETGFDLKKEPKSFFAVSADSTVIAMNANGHQIEFYENSLGQEAAGHLAFVITSLDRNDTSIPRYDVEHFENTFSISDGGAVLAVVRGDHVSVAQRISKCSGANIRIVLNLDESPGSISWSLDYTGILLNKNFPTDNIAQCKNCYAGDPRYARVVVAEDFCVPNEIAGCVQFTFQTEGKMGDGGGFVAFKNGLPFARYSGLNESKYIAPGSCDHECARDETQVKVLMSFDAGFPKQLDTTHQSKIWSSGKQSLPLFGPILIQQCVPSNDTSSLRFHRNAEDAAYDGSYQIFLNDTLAAMQIFDVGLSQTVNLESFVTDQNSSVVENIPARCPHDGCPECSLCPGELVVDISRSADVGGFESISCGKFADLARAGGVSPEFCEAYADGMQIQCDCHVVECAGNEVAMSVTIEFDSSPTDISFIVRSDEGFVWLQDFADFDKLKWAMKTSTFSRCVPSHGPLYFQINDRLENGLCCDGDSSLFLPASTPKGYEVHLGSELVGIREFPFGFQQNMVFRAGAKTSPVLLEQSSPWCFTNGDCNLPCYLCPGGGTYNEQDSITLETYGRVSCLTYETQISNYFNEETCQLYSRHASSSCGCTTHEHQCTADESKLTFQMDIAKEMTNTTVQVRNQHKSTLFSKVGFVRLAGGIGKFEACVPSQEPFYVGVNGNQGQAQGTFSLSLDDVVVGNYEFIPNGIDIALGTEYAKSPSTLQSTAPAVSSVETTTAPSFLSGKHPPCDICGVEGKQVTIPDAVVVIPGSDETPSCAEFHEVGLLGWIPANQCSLAVGVVSILCGCEHVEDEETPRAPSSPFIVPSSAPSFEPGDNPPCDICGDGGKKVTIPGAVVVIHGREETTSCEEFYKVGLLGWIPGEQCSLAVVAASAICGCALPDFPDGAPIGAPFAILDTNTSSLWPSMDPTKHIPSQEPSSDLSVQNIKPGEILEPGPFSKCDICGAGKQISLNDVILTLPGREEKPTCEEFGHAGLVGLIPEDQCPLVMMLVSALCGCVPMV